MCGLLAFVSADGRAAGWRDAVAAALATLRHRGPDARAVTTAGDDAVFGFHRLSIIDVAGSHQPLSYADGRYLIAFNGEIYNYRQLRDRLRREHGARFDTDGDTEVVVAAYHHWGPRAVRLLRGMFAFVVWDAVTGRAFGARDPFGIKPLYHLRGDEGLLLASEAKALLPFVPRAVDTGQLGHYLRMQYVPEPASLHRDVCRLGPGEWFTYRPRDGSWRTGRYWRPEFRPARVSAAGEAALHRRIRAALRDSVTAHLRADVPVGAFLSGGIDSAAIVALAGQVNPDLRTFTAALDVDGYRELEEAQRTARTLGVANHAVAVTPQMMMDALPRIVWHLDDPVADPSLVPLWFVARAAARQVTVVLSGEGADELFGGYPLYREPLALRRVAGLPPALRRGLRALARVVPAGVKGRGFLRRATTPLEQRYDGGARIFDPEERAVLLRGGSGPAGAGPDPVASRYAECAGLDEVTRMQYVDLHTWLVGDILHKADRVTMAHSLELRVPYLDYAVFDVASRIPVALRLPPRSRQTKSALRRALAPVVPADVVDRPKLGFPTPIRVWLRGEMYEWARDILVGSGATDLIDTGYAVRLLDAHRRGGVDHSRKVWTVLVFCLWHALFLEGTRHPGPASAAAVAPAGPLLPVRDMSG